MNKDAKSILEAGLRHVEKNGMDTYNNCPRYIILRLAKEKNRDVIDDFPNLPGARKALRLLDLAARNDDVYPLIPGPGEYAEGWALKHPDDPDLFTKALALL